MDFGNVLRILQINVEGLSPSKSAYLSKLAIDNKIDVILIQELHVATVESLLRRGSINHFVLAGFVLHPIYGCATYVREDLSDWQLVLESSANNIYQVTIKIALTTIVNLYKPPNVGWPNKVLDIYQHPAVYFGDFNSHHTFWGYDNNDINGDDLLNWCLINNLHLKFDAKELGTFNSARWNREFNPDLCFVSLDNQFLPLFSNRKVLGGFPHSQHRPVILEIGLSIPVIKTIPKPRWNFKKANWSGFSKAMDANIRFIPAVSSNYDRFVKMVVATAKKFIPRGFRKSYIPGWSPLCNSLYEEYQQSGSPTTANELLRSLDSSRNENWISLMESMDFKHSSRKSWNLLKKLDISSVNRSAPSLKCSVNAIASRLVANSKAPMDKATSNNIKLSLKEKIKICSGSNDDFNREFTMDEISDAITCLKPNKAVGLDGMFNEFFIHFGPNCKRWLSNFYSDILFSAKIPPAFLHSKISVFVKPGKSGDLPEHYRPIALLSSSYKLLERLIFSRISERIYSMIPTEQAGFRPGRSCCDQILSLTSYIESGFQSKLKTGVAYIDLSAAYDTVWRKGLLYKLINVIPSSVLISLLNNMLSNRRVSVYLGDKSSRSRRLNDGLPQGSVLAPLLFILYISDLPTTKSDKFIYADDIALAVQDRKFENIDLNLSSDLQILWSYFKNWRLKPNIQKCVTNYHHLTNCLSNKSPHVVVDNIEIRHDPYPKYLGVVLDRSLTYKQHIEGMSKKLKSRTNIIHKLAGSTWGANFHTLRTSTLALVFSVAEYCCPVWINSHHVNKIDVVINCCLRIITGCVNSTALPWLHVLSNIAPPTLRRQYLASKTWNKIAGHPDLLCHKIISNQPSCRLSSRNASYQTCTQFFLGYEFSLEEHWEEFWNASDVFNKFLISNLDVPPPGSNLSRKLWVTLNRIRTGQGRCAACLFKWNLSPSAACDCGQPEQTMSHIVNDCSIRAFPGGIEELNLLSSDAVQWLENIDIIL